MKNKSINWLEQICNAIKSISLGNSQNDWNETDVNSPAYIKNKPTIPAAQVPADWSQTDNSKADYIKNKPSIPAAQVQADWNQSDDSAADFIKNKPSIPSNVIGCVTLSGLPTALMDSVADIDAIGLTSAVAEACAKGQVMGFLHNNTHADWFFKLDAATYSAPSVWSLSFSHIRWKVEESGSIVDSQTYYYTVSRSGDNVSVAVVAVE